MGVTQLQLLQERYGKNTHLIWNTIHAGKWTKTKNVDDMLHAMKIIDQKLCDSFKPVEFYGVPLGIPPCFKVDNVMNKG